MTPTPTQAQTKKTRDSQAVWWGVVLQNQVEPKVPKDDVMRLLTFNTNVDKWVFQEENGAKHGGLHFQMCVKLVVKKRKDQVLDMFEELMPTREAVNAKIVHKVKALRKYCVKRETRVAGPWSSEKKWLPKPKVLDPLEGREYYAWQQDIITKIAGKPADRQIHWYWEHVGNVGKSAFTKHLVLTKDALVLGEGTSKDLYHAIAECVQPPDIIILDFPRSFHLSVELIRGMEKIKDGCFFCPKYESRMFTMNPPHLIVFANEPPPMDVWSADRYDVTEITL